MACEALAPPDRKLWPVHFCPRGGAQLTSSQQRVSHLVIIGGLSSARSVGNDQNNAWGDWKLAERSCHLERRRSTSLIHCRQVRIERSFMDPPFVAEEGEVQEDRARRGWQRPARTHAVSRQHVRAELNEAAPLLRVGIACALAPPMEKQSCRVVSKQALRKSESRSPQRFFDSSTAISSTPRVLGRHWMMRELLDES